VDIRAAAREVLAQGVVLDIVPSGSDAEADTLAREQVGVGSLLRGKEGSGLTVSTFHNLGLNIIRKEHAHLGYKPGFSIFDEGDIKALLADIMQKEYQGDDGVDEIKNLIGAWKNDLILPEEALERARNPREQTAAIVYLHYQRTLKAYNAVDFDDLILLPVKPKISVPRYVLPSGCAAS